MTAIYKDLLARAKPFPSLHQMLLGNGHVPLPRKRSACLFDAMTVITGWAVERATSGCYMAKAVAV
ncbi:MAG: hypothetical protein ACNYPG_03290 [Candidatus Porifericomitaceae bacterium WSBS_2022_MAG_OTU9]